MIRVVLHDDAEHDAARVAQRYEDERTGLGDAFLGHLDVAVREIAEHPRAAAIWAHPAITVEVRRHVMRRFPFVLPYHLREDLVTVLAVSHMRRRPDFWLTRLSRGLNPSQR